MAIVVHFGMHKTGSSSIQTALHSGLDDPAFMYVSMGGANQSGKLATLCMEHPENFHLHRKLGRSSAEVQVLRGQYLRRLDEQAAALGDRTALLSAEKISQMTPSELVTLRECLAERFGEVRLVGYVRAPISFIESAFQQRVKDARWMEGGAEPFSGFWPGYRERFAAFDDVFGPDNVQFWLFEPDRFVNGDVVADFVSRLGVRYVQQSVVRSNESISLPAIRLLYVMRRFGGPLEAGPHLVRCNARLVEKVSGLHGPRLRLDAETAARVLERNRDDLEWMESRLGCSLREEPLACEGPFVASEQDLVEIGSAECEWLSQHVGSSAASKITQPADPVEVAGLMFGLYQQICAEEAASHAGVARQQ